LLYSVDKVFEHLQARSIVGKILELSPSLLESIYLTTFSASLSEPSLGSNQRLSPNTQVPAELPLTISDLFLRFKQKADGCDHLTMHWSLTRSRENPTTLSKSRLKDGIDKLCLENEEQQYISKLQISKRNKMILTGSLHSIGVAVK
jgi:hypothetical protein